VLVVGCATALVLTAPLGVGAVVPQSIQDEPGGDTWNATAAEFRGRDGSRFVYTCPSYGVASAVWGTDVYMDDSSVCTAAVHAGRITLAGGGQVTIEIRPGQDSYAGSTRNDITSESYGPWVGSYVIVAATPARPGVGVGGATWTASAAAFRNYVGARFAYTCPADGEPDSIWGTDVYTDDSSVCTAGVHTGLITLAGGGNVTIEMRPGQASYTGSIRNGITSLPYPDWYGSYVIVGAGSGSGPPSGSATGTVLVNGQPFTGGTVAYGSDVDVTKGKLDMSTEAGDLTVYGGAGVTSKFKLVRATSNKRALVELRLIGGDFSSCGKRVLAAGAKPKKPIRRLWGKGKGRFRSKGRFSTASVRGTTWLTEDRCEGTLTSVTSGIVSVFDSVKKKTIMVRAGRSYLARPKK
jgi:LCCL domain-containing protein